MLEVNVRLLKAHLVIYAPASLPTMSVPQGLLSLLKNMDWKHIGKLLKSLWNTESV